MYARFFPALSRRALICSLAMAAAAPCFAAQAEAFPTKPIKWTVGFPAGGGTDVLARTVGVELARQLKQQVVIDNRAGAAGMIAAEAVSHAAPDGYNLLTADVAILAFNPAIYPRIRYDAQKSFASVGLMGRFPILIAASPQSGIKNMDELMEQIRKGSMGYGTAGVGTPHHLAMEMLLGTTGTQADHVPYKGDAPALQDLAGGQIKVAALAPSLSLPFVKEGKLVPLAVTGDKRLAQLPQVPTLKELNLAQHAVYAWQGLVVPRDTAAERVRLISKALQASLANADVVRKLADLGMEAIPGTPEAMSTYVRQEQDRWGPIIKARGITNQ
ncbi:MAG: tripartite tricarboxylate transporter substrate binding protein [Comamonas sp.]